MRVTIIADDGVVGVDGEFRSVDLSALDPNVHAVQWDGAKGHVEYRDRSPETPLADLAPYQPFIDAWAAAAPPPPTLDELKALKLGEFVAEGVARVAAQVPDWDSLEAIKTVAGLWASHLASSATAEQTKAKDIYLYVRDTVPAKLTALTSQAELDLVDPTAAQPFASVDPTDPGWPA